MAQINDKQVGIPGTLYKNTLTNIQAISSPVEGMLAEDTVSHNLYYYNGSNWTQVGSGSSGANSIIAIRRGWLNI